MEISFIVVLWVIVSVMQAILERKKPPPADFEFEMPTPSNEPIKPAEVHEVDLAELYQQQKAERVQSAAQSKTKLVDEKNFDVELTPAAAMNAIILSEILEKPKALRKRR